MSIEARINFTATESNFVVLSATVTRDGARLEAGELASGSFRGRWTYDARSDTDESWVEIPSASASTHVSWDTTGLPSGHYRVRFDSSYTPQNGIREEHTATARLALATQNGVRTVGQVPFNEVGRDVGRDFGAQLREVSADLATGQVFQLPRAPVVDGPVPVQLTRTGRPATEDEILWIVIRNTTNNLSFRNYMRFMDLVMCGDGAADDRENKVRNDGNKRTLPAANPLRLPFPGVDPYRQLKVATESFLQIYCGVRLTGIQAEAIGEDTLFSTPKLRMPLLAINRAEEEARFGRRLDELELLWKNYTNDNIVLNPSAAGRGGALPYLAIVRAKLPEVAVRQDGGRGFDCLQILQEKLLNPCFLELIWSYWHEEGMLVQTLLKLVDRFQNRRAPGDRDPLANLEIDPLRSLNGFFWGYLQDEQHRLGVRRRAHEYLHHYGISLHGKAVSDVRAADRRSKFLESFHNLLYQCSLFYRQEDDTTIVADGFPVMNALKETHYVLAQGAHNQFGDLPATARQEMLIEQWLLARPEMREFLGGRVMVPYPEVWMDRVDAMKSLQGWSDVSVVHFRDLGVYGEQILLSVRYGAWSTVNDPNQAANWARYWRPEVQAYLHAYRAVTGVDITADVTAPRELAARFLPPSVHLRNRLLDQARR